MENKQVDTRYLAKLKPKQETDKWNGKNERLAFAHHKIPKSALIWLYEHMNEKMQIKFKELLSQDNIRSVNKISLNNDELEKKLKKLEIESVQSEKTANEDQEEIQENLNNGLFLAKLRGNLIAPHEEGTRPYAKVEADKKVESSKRNDDPHQNADQIKKYHQLDLVENEDGSLTPRSEIYLDLVTKEIYDIYNAYKDFKNSSKKKLNFSLPKQEVDNFLKIVEFSGETTLGKKNITSNWLKKYSQAEDHVRIDKAFLEYGKRIEDNKKSENIVKSIFSEKLAGVKVPNSKTMNLIKKDATKAKMSLENYLESDNYLKNEINRENENNPKKTPITLEDYLKSGKRIVFPEKKNCLTDNEIDLIIDYIDKTKITVLGEQSINEELLNYCTRYEFEGIIKKKFSSIQKERIDFGKLVGAAKKSDTSYTKHINKIDKIKDDFVIDDETALNILTLLYKAELLHIQVEEDRTYPSHSGGIFGKDKYGKFGKLPAKKFS